MDKMLLRKSSVIETLNEEYKNICQVEHLRILG
nr:transposase [Algoriphagus resistens]